MKNEIDKNSVSESNDILQGLEALSDDIATDTSTLDVEPGAKAPETDDFSTNAMTQAEQEPVTALSAFKPLQNASTVRKGNSSPSIGIVYTPRNGNTVVS